MLSYTTDILPNRNAEAGELIEHVSDVKQTAASKPGETVELHCQIVDPYEKSEKHDGNYGYFIYMIGFVPSGHKACVIVRNVPVYFDVKTPDKYVVDVKVVTSPPTPIKDDPFGSWLKTKFHENGLYFKRIETVLGKPLKGFLIDPVPWKRIYFSSLKERHDAIEFVQAAGYQTASDDTKAFGGGFYYQMLARRFRFNAAGWNIVQASRLANNAVNSLSKGIDILRYECDLVDIKAMPEATIARYPIIKRDRLVMCLWDIETITYGENTGDVPAAEDKNYEIRMICAVYCFQGSQKPIASVCIQSNIVHMHPELLNGRVIIAKDECGVLETFIESLNRMRPDITCAFNGGKFDWPLVREKCKRYNLLQKLRDALSCVVPGAREGDIAKAYFRPEKVKISAEENHEMLTAKFPGTIDTDCMVVFKKLYPTSEVGRGFSLNFYLRMNKLEGKEDMPYARMWRIFELADIVEGKRRTMTNGKCMVEYITRDEAAITQALLEYTRKYYPDGFKIPNGWDPKLFMASTNATLNALAISADATLCTTMQYEMTLVMYYCAIDAYRCQQLYLARSIIDDHRELSNLTYVALYDSFYRADGMKVRNIIGRFCAEYGIMFSNAKEENDKVKFPGAWVFRPKKGLNARKPTVALDASSLYPSLMMVGNLSPDKAIVRLDAKRLNPTVADTYVQRLLALGYVLYHIKFTCANGLVVEGWTVRHNGNHLMTHESQYIIANHEEEPEVEITVPPTGWDPKSVDFDMGIASSVTEKSSETSNVTGTSATLSTSTTSTTSSVVASSAATSRVVLETRFRKQKDGSLIPVKGRPCLPGESFGVFPFTEKRLFDMRVELKKPFNALKLLKERCEKLGVTKDSSDYASVLTEKDIAGTGIATTRDVQYDDVVHSYNKLNSKQTAIKKIMNTFFGESGNFRSAIYELLVAGGITTSGQLAIKEVSNFLTLRGYDVRYGDTDSNYLCCPDWMFAVVNRIAVNQFKVVYTAIKDTPTKGIYKTPHWVAIDAIYRSVDAGFASRIKAKTATQDEYYADESAFAKALEYVRDVETKERSGVATESASVEMKLPSTRDAWRALKSRAREDYWIKMVQITRCDIESLRVRVNDHIAKFNGTEFLKMAYEEVLFPCVFTGKKKYFGFQHMQDENFHPDDKSLFVKGMDFIKQGQTLLAKEQGYEIVQEVCSVDNYDTLQTIIERRLRQLWARDFDIKHFVKKAKYKKPKEDKPGAVCNLKFVDRQREIKRALEASGDFVRASFYKIPDWGDRFEFVVTKNERKRNLRGNLQDIKQSDKMELLEVYNASQEAARLTSSPPTMVIDLEYYMDNAIYGLFARFMSYKSEFEPENALEVDFDDKEQYKKYDETIIKNGRKWIEAYCASFRNVTKPNNAVGTQMRSTYNRAAATIEYGLYQMVGMAASVFEIDMYSDVKQAVNRTGRFAPKPLEKMREYVSGISQVDSDYGEQQVLKMILQTSISDGQPLTIIKIVNGRAVEAQIDTNNTVQREEFARRRRYLLTLQTLYLSKAPQYISYSKRMIEECDAGIAEHEKRFLEIADRYLAMLVSRDHIFNAVICDLRADRDVNYSTCNGYNDEDKLFIITVYNTICKWSALLMSRRQTQSVCLAIMKFLAGEGQAPELRGSASQRVA